MDITKDTYFSIDFSAEEIKMLLLKEAKRKGWYPREDITDWNYYIKAEVEDGYNISKIILTINNIDESLIGRGS